MKKHLYIFTECGSQIGYGHLTRCMALYDEAQEQGLYTKLVLHTDEAWDAKILQGRSYSCGAWYDDPWKTAEANPEQEWYAIVDSYKAGADTYAAIAAALTGYGGTGGIANDGSHAARAVYIDDTNRIDYPSGIIVNPSLCGEELPYSKKENQIYLLGPKYVVLRKAFYELPTELKDQRAKRKGHIKDILIVMGGADVKNLTPKLMKVLNQSDEYGDCRQHVVVGNGFDNRGEIQAAAKTAELYHNINAEEMRDLMLSCDVAISAAGQTVHEMIAAQLPFVCIKVVDNQEYNVKGLQKHGIISEYFDCEGKTDDQINKELQRLPEMLNELKMSRGIGDAVKMQNGAENIMKELLA